MNLQDKDLNVKFDTTKPDIPTTVILDCTKAKDKLGWTPKTSLESGLKKTCDWYENNYLGSACQ